MNTKMKILALCCGLGLSTGVMAKDPYVGFKAGLMTVDLYEYSDSVNVGAFMGVPLSNTVAIEGEFTTTAIKGDLNLGWMGKYPWSITTFAVYGAIRTEGPTYMKMKAGFLSENLDVDVGGITVGGTDSGASLGFGFGFKGANKGQFEIEYTIIESDINFLSLGYMF